MRLHEPFGSSDNLEKWGSTLGVFWWRSVQLVFIRTCCFKPKLTNTQVALELYPQMSERHWLTFHFPNWKNFKYKLDLRTIFCFTQTVFSPAASEQNAASQDPGHFLERLASCQAHRLDDQRASGSHFPGLHLSTCNPPHIPSTSSTDPAPPQGSLWDSSCFQQGGLPKMTNVRLLSRKPSYSLPVQPPWG